MAQWIKNLSAMQETRNPWVKKIPWRSNLQHSYLENCMDKEPGRLQSLGSQRVRHDSR